MNEKTHPLAIEVILEALRKTDAAVLTCSMYGSGDEGCTEDFELLTNAAMDATVDLTQPVSYIIKPVQSWQKIRYMDDVPLKQAIEDHIEYAVEKTDVDWYNGSGGAGEYSLDIVNGIETIVMSQYELVVVETVENKY